MSVRGKSTYSYNNNSVIRYSWSTKNENFFVFQMKVILCCWKWKHMAHCVSNPSSVFLWMTCRAVWQKIAMQIQWPKAPFSLLHAILCTYLLWNKILHPSCWVNTTDYPHGLTEIEESLCCAEPRTGLDSCNNAIVLDLKCVSSQLPERSDPEPSTLNAKACSLILGYGNQDAMVTVLEKQRGNLEGRKETKVLSQEDKARTGVGTWYFTT